MDHEILICELLELPEKIKAIENKLVAHTLKRSEIEGLMSGWDNSTMLAITSEQVDGKAKFTNEMQRKAALSQKQSESKDYRDLSEQLNKKVQEENLDKIEFNFLDRRFKALRTVADLIAGRRE